MKLADDGPVVIVGMGGGGLTAAIDLIQRGIRVVIFENRDHFVRPQWVHLDISSNNYIQTLLDPKDPLDDKFRTNHNTDNVKFSRIRTLQKFLFRKLLALQIQHPELVTIHRGKHFKITGIDPVFQTLYFEEGPVKKRVDFSHLLEADGARNAMTNLLNKSARDQELGPFFYFQPKDIQPRHPYCGVIQCKLNLPELFSNKNLLKDLLLRADVTWELDDCEKLKNAGWNSPYFPMVALYGKCSEGKLNLGCEIPEYLYKLSNNPNNRDLFQQQFLEWARLIVFNHFDKLKNSQSVSLSSAHLALLQALTPESLIILPAVLKSDRSEDYVAELQHHNVSAFLITLSNATQPSVRLGKNGTFTLIGDSFQTPYFFRYHGMNDAIEAALSYSRALSSSNDINQFLSHVNTTMHHIKTVMGNRMHSDISRNRRDAYDLSLTYNELFFSKHSLWNSISKSRENTIANQKAIGQLRSLFGSLEAAPNLASLDHIIKLRNTVRQFFKTASPFMHHSYAELFAKFEKQLRSFVFDNIPTRDQPGQTKHLTITSNIYQRNSDRAANESPALSLRGLF